MAFRWGRDISSACMHLCSKVPRIWGKEASGWPAKTTFLITGRGDMPGPSRESQTEPRLSQLETAESKVVSEKEDTSTLGTALPQVLSAGFPHKW